MFINLILQKIPLINKIDFSGELKTGVDNLVGLMEDLIKVSIKRVENNENLTSMLDFMVQSHLNGEMSKDELKSNVFIFFLAGHETTATTLAFVVQVLCKHSDIQEKLRKEINEYKEEITHQNINELKYLNYVIKENMRLYGIVPGVQKKSKKRCCFRRLEYSKRNQYSS